MLTAARVACAKVELLLVVYPELEHRFRVKRALQAAVQGPKTLQQEPQGSGRTGCRRKEACTGLLTCTWLQAWLQTGCLQTPVEQQQSTACR